MHIWLGIKLYTIETVQYDQLIDTCSVLCFFHINYVMHVYNFNSWFFTFHLKLLLTLYNMYIRGFHKNQCIIFYRLIWIVQFPLLCIHVMLNCSGSNTVILISTYLSSVESCTLYSKLLWKWFSYREYCQIEHLMKML